MAAPFRAGQFLGWAPGQLSAASSVTLSAAANWFAVSFVPYQARTLSAVRSYVNQKTGTLAAGDITCDLYDSTGTNGAPGSAVESGKLPSATITAADWYDFTGFTTALTAAIKYWLVFKNVNATPASNNCTFQAISNLSPNLLIGNTSRQSWDRGTTTNSGSTWSVSQGAMGTRVGYADGGYDGLPVSDMANGAAGTSTVYGAREHGVRVTLPSAGAALRVAGLALLVAGKSGTPTGLPRMGLWSGSSPSLLAYTVSSPAAVFAGTANFWFHGNFSSVQTVQPGSVLRVTLAEETNADASANAYVPEEYTWDSNANSLALLPLEGTAQKTYFDGSSWTNTSGLLSGFALLLDTSQEFQTNPLGAITGARSIGTY